MSKPKIIFATILSILCMNFSSLISEQVIVRTPSGDSITVEVNSEESFSDVMKSVGQQVNNVEKDDRFAEQSVGRFLIDYMFGSSDKCRKSFQGPRDYYRTVNGSEKEDITYVLKTLAKGSWSELMRKEDSLKKAGKRFDHIHPLRFLQFMLKDDPQKGYPLRTYLYGILEGSSKVKREFFDKGLFENLEKETSNQKNMKVEYIEDFARGLNLDPSHFMQLIQNRQWNDLMKTIVRLLPREGEIDRHGRQ